MVLQVMQISVADLKKVTKNARLKLSPTDSYYVTRGIQSDADPFRVSQNGKACPCYDLK